MNPRATPGTRSPAASASWRGVARACLPLALGAAAPWIIWGAAGRVAAAELAAAGLASAAVFLHALGTLPPRRHRPGPALLACCGLAASLMLPGMSALALIDAVGLAQATGLPAGEQVSLAFDGVGATVHRQD